MRTGTALLARILHPILGLSLLNSLPLHIGRGIRSARPAPPQPFPGSPSAIRLPPSLPRRTVHDQPARMPASGVRKVCDGLFPAILRPSLFDSLPLHIGRGIRPAALQGDHMVDDVAGAWAFRLLGSWAGVFAHECCSGGFAAPQSGFRLVVNALLVV